MADNIEILVEKFSKKELCFPSEKELEKLKLEIDLDFSNIGEYSTSHLAGELHPRYGITHDEESKKLMSVAATGRTRSEKSRIKQSKSVSGDKNHFYGKTHSAETRKNLSELKKIQQSGARNNRALSLEYNGRTYSTQEELSKYLNISEYHIRKMRKSGEIKTLGYTHGRK